MCCSIRRPTGMNWRGTTNAEKVQLRKVHSGSDTLSRRRDEPKAVKSGDLGVAMTSVEKDREVDRQSDGSTNYELET